MDKPFFVDQNGDEWFELSFKDRAYIVIVLCLASFIWIFLSIKYPFVAMSFFIFAGMGLLILMKKNLRNKK